MEQEQQILKEAIELVWGSLEPQAKLFERWSQGFVFSTDEATALQQLNGGPCSVIAPVQAFILKNAIPHYSMEQLKQLSSAAVDGYLTASLTEMLCLCGTEAVMASNSGTTTHHRNPSDTGTDDTPANLLLKVVNIEGVEEENTEPSSTFLHSHLRIKEFTSRDALLDYIKNNLSAFKSRYGVLLFLYSAILTRGVTTESVAESCGGPVLESLINSNEGHGEQPLVNLLLTGTPSAHVFDGTRDVGGLKLQGVWSRPSIGLLHLQEHYKQLKVGWYFKNPQHPVWLCASQTHLTVLFSLNRELVCPATAIERGHQVFSWYDTEGNGFIERDQLKAVLQHLDLCTDDEFVKFMCDEMDPDNMGVILYHKFQDAFFSGHQLHSAPDTFTIYHYNGLLASNPNKSVQFAKGYATRQELHVNYSSMQHDITACLSTKWANIDLQWENGTNSFTPSLN